MVLDREIELAKLDLLNSCPDFNLYDAFKIVDDDGKGYVTAYDLTRAFKDP